MSLIGSIAANLIGRVNIEKEVEDLAAPAAAKLIAPHVHLDAAERAKSMKRLQDAAACLGATPPKDENALTDILQVIEDMLD